MNYEQCVIGLCDAQLLTGISILFSGFVSLYDYNHMTLSSWLMMTNLAWFSNLTHQYGLVFLRGYFYENHRERTWRVVLMTVLLVTLVCAWVPTAGAVVFDTRYGAQPTTPALVRNSQLFQRPYRT
jgi:lysylphosphatidylglycerol synthetase-like protein (DUF2156 family)